MSGRSTACISLVKKERLIIQNKTSLNIRAGFVRHLLIKN